MHKKPLDTTSMHTRPMAQQIETAKDNLRKPAASKSSLAPPSNQFNPRLGQSLRDGIPTQAGCSTLGAGGYRNKVRLKPGHSALDWHALASGKGKSQGLVVGIDRLLSEDMEKLQQLNHPHTLIQLQRDVPPYLIRPLLNIDRELLQKHKTLDDCWCVIKGRVYCLTYYFDFHPGGVDILFKTCAGKDGTEMFNKYHRWVSFDKLLETCLVGVFVS